MSDKIQAMPKTDRLNATIRFAVKAVANDKIWKRPTKQKVSKQYPKKDQEAARHLANTFLIELPGTNDCLNKALSKNEMLAIELKSKQLCRGECESVEQGEGIEIMCQECTHL
jgi:hypothetical protein